MWLIIDIELFPTSHIFFLIEFGESQTIELIPGGSDIPVTNGNRIRYIYMMANYRLNRQIDRQCKAFFRGLSDLIDEKWLRMFNQVKINIVCLSSIYIY